VNFGHLKYFILQSSQIGSQVYLEVNIKWE